VCDHVVYFADEVIFSEGAGGELRGDSDPAIEVEGDGVVGLLVELIEGGSERGAVDLVDEDE
jgi:hypothetical protein